MRGNACQAEICLAKKPVKYEDKINTFSDEWELRKLRPQISFLKKELEDVFRQNEAAKYWRHHSEESKAEPRSEEYVFWKPDANIVWALVSSRGLRQIYSFE